MAEERYQASITGMHCAACSSRIERVVGALDGVEKCSVNLATARAVVVYNPALIDPALIEERISGLGFGAIAETVGAAKDHAAEAREGAARLEAMRRNLLPSFVLALAIMILSMAPMLGISLPRGIHPDHAPLNHAALQFFLLLPVLYLGRNFYLHGFPALWRGVPTMDSLIAIGTGAAFVYSTWNLVEIALGIDAVARAYDLYFESAAMIIALVSLGKYLEARSKAQTGEAIRQLLQLTPDTAIRLESGQQRLVAVREIVAGDQLLIKPGERIPVDGRVVTGLSAVDEAMLTGESMPVDKGVGDPLYGGSLNKHGALTMKAEKVGADTVLARIVRLVEEAQGSKAPIAGLADRISLYFVPVVIAIATLAGLSWFFIGGAEFTFALRIFIAVLVIACPCAMGLATPTSIMVGTGRGAQLGVLVRSGAALERAEKVSTVVFDKTGTLTSGTPQLIEIIPFGNWQEADLLRLAAAAESQSEHPLAEAMLAACREMGLNLIEPKAFSARPGRGISATVGIAEQEYRILLGNRQSLHEAEVSGVNEQVDSQADRLSALGRTVLFLAVDGKLAALFALGDTLKPEAVSSLRRLESLGLSLVMLTGDNDKTARAVAREAGIDKVVAGVLPDRKEQEIAALQKTGEVVAMVGDGINDAPALARADVGIAMGTGIDVAVESADIVLMKGHLGGVATAIGLSRATMRNIRQNLFWAFAYNVLGIPVAAGVLAIFGGPTLSPMLGGAAMALSSFSVVSNALRLRWYQPPAEGSG
ncbi:MAG: heavy metal translocating P-type ATPase [Desulforhopalus sp.]|nr:heavy metal translocating P-type ATPase [Desulforhopalus sp.]